MNIFNQMKYKLLKYNNFLYENFIIYTSSEFKDKWCCKEVWKNKFDYDIKELLNDLVDDINNINKYLLKSLFIFSIKKKLKYLSYLIYEKDKNNFYNPLMTSNIKIKNIPQQKDNFIISSCFTPPDSLFYEYWNKKPINCLDDYIKIKK